MTSCLDAFPFLQRFDWENNRNQIATTTSGILFFGALWLMIDTSVIYTHSGNFNNVYYILTVLGTVAMVMMNSVSISVVTGQAMDEGILGTKGARLWMMFSFVMAFSTLVASLWVMFANYVFVQGDIPNWPGLALFFHNLFILLASLIYKFGRNEELWG